MRNKMSLWKRSLAALLALVMVLGMIPAFGMVPLAYAADGDGQTSTEDNTTEGDGYQEQGPNIQGNYITLPITIRDFAADGMLFEYNEVDKKGIKRTTEKTENQGYSFYYNPTDWGIGGSLGFQVYDLHGSTTDGSWNSYPVIDENTAVYWHCVILDYYGNVLEVIPSGEVKTAYDSIALTDYDGDGYTKGEYDAWYSVWAWAGDGDTNNNDEAYNLLSQITADHKDIYRVGLDLTNYKLQVGNRIRIAGDFGTTPGIRYFDSDDLTLSDDETGRYWHCVICDSDGYVVKVLPKDTIKRGAYEAAMQDGYFSVWAWGGDGTDHSNEIAYNEIACITESNKACYQITFFGSAEGNSTGSDILYVDEIKTYHMADTRAFGLLQTNDNDYLSVLKDVAVQYDANAENDAYLKKFSELIYGTQLFQQGSWNSTTVATDAVSYLFDTQNKGEERGEPYASQIIHGARVRTNLVDMELDAEGKPIYTKETVEFLAEFMQKIMAVPDQNEDGSYNTFHVEGVKMFTPNSDGTFNYKHPSTGEGTLDLADVLRYKVEKSKATDKLGTFELSDAKFKNGKPLLDVETGEEVKDENGNTIMVPALRTYEDVETWCDAAYYMLNNFWRDSSNDIMNPGNDGYGMPISQYESLHLIETTNEKGQTCYVFNAKFDDTVYDFQEGDIHNTQLENGAIVQQWSADANDGEGGYVDTYAYGNPLPVARFDPLGTKAVGADADGMGYGLSGNTYGNMTGDFVDRAEYYDETNFNLSLEGHAQFIYNEAADQYFTFTGDDDVYLYINGIRVLDIGGAHSISKVSVRLNDVAKAIGLHDGETYRFDFFFLERHGTAANFGIETNIQIADSSINTFKTGYQDGANTGYDGPVNPDKHVGYSFEMQNDGDAKIYNLTFNDPTIGVYVGYDRVDLYPEDFTDEDKKLYGIEDLYLIYWNKEGKIVDYKTPGSFDETELRGYLAAGLDQGERIGVFGFKYDITKHGGWVDTNGNPSDGRKKGDSFTNTVSTTANTSPQNDGHQLHGIADWKVHVMALKFDPFHVYDWVNKDVSKDPNTVCNWRSPEEAGLPWGGVTVPKDDLLKYLKDANVTIPTDKTISIVPCTASGNEDEYYKNPNVTLNSDGSITYKSKTVGMDTVFYKVKWDGNTHNDVVFNYDVYTYGSVNNVYVLDYGLSVELAGETFGYQNNDHYQIDQNTKYPMSETHTPLGIVGEVKKNVDGNIVKEWGIITAQDGTYGTFTWTAEDEEGNPLNSLKYTPDEIIDNTDSVFSAFRMMEQSAIDKGEEPSIYNSVVLVQEITTAPASIVYYEEDFPGITYISEGENEWVHYETVNGDGEPVKGTEQSADQDMNYGSDPNYEEDKIGWLDEEAEEIIFKLDTSDHNTFHQAAVSALSEYLGLSDEDSNGTVNELVVKTKADVMWFDFVGTGFEIVSRTTKDMYAVLKVSVHLIDENGDVIVNQKDADGNVPNKDLPATNAAGRVAVIPVITESKGGTLYQVPIISLTGMPKARYRVTVTAAGNADGTRILYIDGLRIYGPLSDGEALKYYNPEEYKAVIYEVKDLIYNWQAIYSEYTFTDDKLKMGTGTTLIEETTDLGFVLNTQVYDETIEDYRDVLMSDYLSVGPNNEIYLDGNSTNTMIAFFLTPDEDVPAAERTIQIGAHRKADSISGFDDNVGMFYASTLEAADVEDITEQPYYHVVSSGTEQYFDIDVKHLVQDEYGRYLVMIVAGESEGGVEPLALTNLKVKGYTIGFNKDDLIKDNEDGDVSQNSLVKASYAMARRSRAQEEPEVEVIHVNENLTITSATLRAKTVASGKTSTLAVKAGKEAATIVVTDAAGNVVAHTRCTRSATSTGVTFTFIWKVSGSRGEVQTYTIRVYDATGLASVNTETVTLTIK